MNIWIYLFIIILIIVIILLILKIITIKKEIKNISTSLSRIIKCDTNNLITLNSNDKNIKELAKILNESLKELRSLELEYKGGNRELKSSITNISHDLRTPLTAIKGYVDIIKESKLNKNNKKYIEVINNKVNDLIYLTEQLFCYTKILDKEEINPEKICINSVLENSIVGFYTLFKSNNIIPKINICEEKIIRYVDENILKRIFENILSNLIKYGLEDINIKLNNKGIITFSNKTNKINNLTINKIFDRYYTVENGKKSNGIGLSIAKQLTELNKGNITAKYKNEIITIEISFNNKNI